MSIKETTLLIVALFTCLRISECLFIDGCPLYGCRPSGTFSFYLKVPTENVSIKWQTSFILDALPDGLGCSANSVSIVCQSNGPFSDDKGYVSLYHSNGTLRWRDGVLNFPTLPILDNYGDVTGSDGVSLVHFDADGKNYPVIPCEGMKPIFSMQLVGTIYLLMVSQRGGLSVRDTSAIPVAEIFLKATVQRVHGTFLPISTPVVNGYRFYLLTEFVPDTNQNTENVLNLQRLYAIDIHHRMADIMTIAWYYNFEMEEDIDKPNSFPRQKAERDKDKLYYKADMGDTRIKSRQESIISKQALLWDSSHNMAYVILPPPYASNSPTTFWGFRDNGNTTKLAFRSDMDVTHMAMFEANDNSGMLNSELTTLWVSLVNSSICSVLDNGNVSKCIDLNDKLGAKATITSKMSLVRNADKDKDVLLFAVNVPKPTVESGLFFRRYLSADTNNTNYVVALDTTPSTGEVLWVVPSPGDLEVEGQITGSRGAAYREKDQIVVFANSVGKAARIFTIH